MNVRDPWCLARDALHQCVVVGKIRKAAKPRAALVRRRLVAVGPGRDVFGETSEFAAAGKIHVDAGAADDEVRGDGAARRLQLDAFSGIARGLDWRTLVQCEIGMTRAAVVSRLREALAHFEDLSHEAPAPGIVEIAEMAQEAPECQPAIRLDQLNLGAAAQQMYFGSAGFQRGRRIVEGGCAGADHRDLPAAQGFEVDVGGSAGASRRR